MLRRIFVSSLCMLRPIPYLRDMISHRSRVVALTTICIAAACTARRESAPEPVLVFAAGSLARPLRAALDSIAAAGGPTARVEIMGSREMLRAITSLGRVPDLIVSADADELERTLVPAYVGSSTTFARNRVVLALSPRSAAADSVTALNWPAIAGGGSLRIARTDPARAPLGYRTQLAWKLAESSLHRAGLAAALAAASPGALVRGNESDLAALLESGDADAAWCYESLARSLKIKYVRLGDAIDLGSDRDTAFYRTVTVRAPGARPGDSVAMVGTPIRYAIAVTIKSGNAGAAAALRQRLLDAGSARIMRRIGLDVLDSAHVTTISAARTR
jgi:molybdate/tungstate transport system substrate-binding protein